MKAVFKAPAIVLILLTAFLSGTPALAQDFDWAPDFPVGATIPALEAQDQNGAVQTLESLSGDRGILLVFNRSFDWCPYCKAQLDSLTEVSAEFEALGFNVVTITYDPVETLKLAEEDFAVPFTMLHDEEVTHVNAFGIRNMDYAAGEFGYGIPQPGIMLVAADGVILAKFAEENYRMRPDWSDVLSAARDL